MKFLKHIRPKSRSEGVDHPHNNTSPYNENGQEVLGGRVRPHPTARYPQALLEHLLSYVCPHVGDDSFASCEQSVIHEGCGLCDLKDLSRCALVNRQWSEATQSILYHSVRIDSVHYCQREIELATKRKRRSYSGQYGSPPQERLVLLSRTISSKASLAHNVQYLKIPYMTREASVAGLARMLSFTPNLLYVDLPDSVYMDDPSSSVLRRELQLRCPRLRHMKYLHGSESSFRALRSSNYWRALEALELSHLTIEPSTIIDIFASMVALREVKLADMPLLDDTLFQPRLTGTSFPPLAKFDLQGTPNITIKGLVAYLAPSKSKIALKHLLLTDTGVQASEIHQILSAAPGLNSFRITANVLRVLAPSQTLPLASPSLKVLHFLISSTSTSPDGLASPSDSYYAYLSSSINSGLFPSLSHLYTLSDTPQSLLPAEPRPLYLSNGMGVANYSLPLGITRPLQLYTKSIQEMEWDITLISPPTPANRRGSITATEPESLYHAPPLSPHYQDPARNSVMVGNGFGGFLAVPCPGSVPRSPKRKDKKKDADAWMG